MPKQFADILATALLSSGVFLAVSIVDMGLILMFLSTIPILSAGFGKSPKIAFNAALLATAIIAALTSSLSASLLFLIIFALPSCYICYAATRHYDIVLGSSMPTLRIWYPIGLAVVNMAVYGNILLAIITALHFLTQESTLPHQLIEMINSEFSTINKGYNVELKVSAENVAFMLCGVLVWIWAFMLLACSNIANTILLKTRIAKRPNLAITPFPMPHWMLFLIAIWALASLIGGESMRFLGKASIIVMLFPYFLQGAALFHLYIHNRPNKHLISIILYVFIAIFWWPALMIAGYGIWNHIKIFNKHLSSGGSSSKN